MLKNVAGKVIVRCFDSTNNTPKTGDAANLTAYVSIDGGALTALADTSATELSNTNAKGYYVFDRAQAESNGDELLFTCKSSTANVVCICCPDVVQTTNTAAVAAAALLDLAAGIETSLTLRQALRVMVGVLGGKSSGAGTATEKFRNINDSLDRVTTTLDSSGNRTAITTNLG